MKLLRGTYLISVIFKAQLSCRNISSISLAEKGLSDVIIIPLKFFFLYFSTEKWAKLFQ